MLHSDFIEYEPVSKEITFAEEGISFGKKRFENVIVIFSAVESEDDENVILDASNEISEYANLVKCDQILIYPYAHLSSDLAPPQFSYEIT